MNYLFNKTYQLTYICSVIIVSAVAVIASFVIASFPPQLHTNIHLNGLEQTAQTAIPIWLIFVLLEVYSASYAEEGYRNLLLDVTSSCASVYINTVGVYSIFVLALFSPTKMISALAAVVVLLLLVAFNVASYRNKAKGETLVATIKVGTHKALGIIFYVSIILCIILLLAVNNIIPYEAEGSPSSDSKSIAETIAFDENYFSLSQNEKLQLYADFIASEANRLGIDPDSITIKPTISSDPLLEASYAAESRTIYINVNGPMLYYAGSSSLMTSLHELFHAYEHDIVLGRITPSNFDYGLSEHADQWRTDIQNYVTAAQNLQEYAEQTLEIDATDFAHQRFSELIDLEEYANSNI